MKEPLVDMSTDSAWEEWGRQDPYYSVITHPKFRRSAMDDDAKREFFGSSESHVQYILATIRAHIDPGFSPRKIMDFGCGVGRLLVAFASVAEEVVGLDVSPSMLREARANCNEMRLTNVRLVRSDDQLSNVTDTFDLIHSYIVFQHIPVVRGRAILSNLLGRLSPGGVAAIHLTYSKARFAATHGIAPPERPSSGVTAAQTRANSDPEMQMNPYNMNEVLFLLQSRGVEKSHLEFTDHGGELAVLLYFRVAGIAR